MDALFCVTVRELEHLYKQHWALALCPGPWLANTHEQRNKRVYLQTRITESSIFGGDTYKYKGQLDTGAKIPSYREMVSNVSQGQDEKRCDLSNAE